MESRTFSSNQINRAMLQACFGPGARSGPLATEVVGMVSDEKDRPDLSTVRYEAVVTCCGFGLLNAAVPMGKLFPLDLESKLMLGIMEELSLRSQR